MKLSQFKFDLPLNLIAQHPTKKREDARMMVVHRHTGQIENKHFRDILDYFDDKDVFVVNNTKVFPARMYGRKEKTGAKIEVFLLRELNKPNRLWDVIVDPARKIRVGNKLYFGEQEDLVAEVIDNTTSRGRTICIFQCAFPSAFLLLFVSVELASAVGHYSVYTTNELSLKRPLDEKSGLRLVSIGSDGLVTIKQSDGTVLTTHPDKSKKFCNRYGHTTDIHLLSVSEAKDRVVIRLEMRVYPVPPAKR